jgi:hypothetical protein
MIWNYMGKGGLDNDRSERFFDVVSPSSNRIGYQQTAVSYEGGAAVF